VCAAAAEDSDTAHAQSEPCNSASTNARFVLLALRIAGLGRGSPAPPVPSRVASAVSALRNQRIRPPLDLIAVALKSNM
jgi:hypothetical protein